MAKSSRPRCECCDEVLEELLGIKQNFEKYFHRFNTQIVELRREVRAFVGEPTKLEATADEVLPPKTDKNAATTKRKAATMRSDSPRHCEDSSDGATSSSNSRYKQQQKSGSKAKQRKLQPQANVKSEKTSTTTPSKSVKRPVLDFFGIQLRVLPSCPFNTDVEFEQWDNLLLDDEDQRDLLRIELLQGHFDDSEKYIKHIWSTVLGDGALQHFSYKGNAKTNKKSVKDMIFTSIFKECFLQRYERHDALFFMENTIRFFNYAHDRLRRGGKVSQSSFEKVHLTEESTIADDEEQYMDGDTLLNNQINDEGTDMNFVNMQDFESGSSSKDLMEIRRAMRKDLETLEQHIKTEFIQQDERLKIMLKSVLKGKDLKSRTSHINYPHNIGNKASSLVPRQPFTNIEEFKKFEKKIENDKDKFFELVHQLEQSSDKNAEKFIRNCWRKLLVDEAAQYLCWKGTETKLAVRALSVTAAIKTASQNKFVDSVDSEFDRTCMFFFQHAKNRYEKRRSYQSKIKGTKDEGIYGSYMDESQQRTDDVDESEQTVE